VIRRLSSEAGVTLAESLVAVAILGAALVVFLTGISTGAITTSKSDNQSTAHQLARSQIEYVKTLPYQGPGTTYPSVAAPSGFAVNAAADNVDGGDSDIEVIRVEVLHGGNVVYTLEGYRVNR
jgi:type II secretory pathway pseudopilin PulG